MSSSLSPIDQAGLDVLHFDHDASGRGSAHPSRE
jgi:hypothetical protein